jgi:hypothetical protein
LADSSNNEPLRAGVLVLRAAFVPDSEQPPPEFQSALNPLRIPARRDPATGEITCVNAGLSILGDLRAEWHPDQNEDANGAGEALGDDDSPRRDPSAARPRPEDDGGGLAQSGSAATSGSFGPPAGGGDDGDTRFMVSEVGDDPGAVSPGQRHKREEPEDS